MLYKTSESTFVSECAFFFLCFLLLFIKLCFIIVYIFKIKYRLSYRAQRFYKALNNLPSSRLGKIGDGGLLLLRIRDTVATEELPQ